jgi:hypothetical protein
VEQFVTQAVARYRDRIQAWHAAAGLNRSDLRGLEPEQRIQLTALMIENVRREAPDAEVFFSVDQPWGEYLREATHEWSPFVFAESIVRARLGVTALGLRLLLGNAPQSSGPRDALGLLRLIDRWASLGLPLIVFLDLPDATGSIAAASDQAARQADLQRLVMQELLPLLACQRSVMSVIWEGAPGSLPHEQLWRAFSCILKGQLPAYPAADAGGLHEARHACLSENLA